MTLDETINKFETMHDLLVDLQTYTELDGTEVLDYKKVEQADLCKNIVAWLTELKELRETAPLQYNKGYEAGLEKAHQDAIVNIYGINLSRADLIRFLEDTKPCKFCIHRCVCPPKPIDIQYCSAYRKDDTKNETD